MSGETNIQIEDATTDTFSRYYDLIQITWNIIKENQGFITKFDCICNMFELIMADPFQES